jgi:hypothetical protein
MKKCLIIKSKSIDNNSKLFLFKAFKSKNKSEFYLKYPDFEIRRLICKFRLWQLKRDDIRKYLGIYERSINVKFLMTKTIFFYCKLNDHLRKAFLSDFDNINNTNLLEIILSPTNIKQMKSLGSFIKQSLELKTGGTWFHLFYCVLNLFICCTLYVYVLLTIQCSHWPWLGWKLCLIKLKKKITKII